MAQDYKYNFDLINFTFFSMDKARFHKFCNWPYLDFIGFENELNGGSTISQRRASTLQLGCQPIIWQDFCQKLYGN